MRTRGFVRAAAWLTVAWAVAAGLQAQGRGQLSPASVRPTQARRPQTYTREQIDLGRVRFAAQCGFCHGRDAAGGEGGTDLTRSELVGADARGDRIRPLVRSGRPEKGMPAFTLPEADLTAIVAFIHDQRAQAAAATGGRRAVEATDLQTGNAEAGRQYFAHSCARCHSGTGDLAGVATRYQGLALLQRMLYPGTGRGAGPPPRPPRITVSLRSGQTVVGRLAYRDEFTITLTDDTGWRRSWPTSQVTYAVDDPLQAHVEQLGQYTDADMHDVLAYVRTLR
jgi:cytochrome c oxidase cbb3-type subunit 3